MAGTMHGSRSRRMLVCVCVCVCVCGGFGRDLTFTNTPIVAAECCHFRFATACYALRRVHALLWRRESQRCRVLVGLMQTHVDRTSMRALTKLAVPHYANPHSTPSHMLRQKENRTEIRTVYRERQLRASTPHSKRTPRAHAPGMCTLGTWFRRSQRIFYRSALRG